jgi:hypothetical protein
MRLFSNFTKAQRAFLKSIRDSATGPERFPKPGTLDSWLQNPKFKEVYEMLQRDIQREIDLRMLLLQRTAGRTLTAGTTAQDPATPLGAGSPRPPSPSSGTPREGMGEGPSLNVECSTLNVERATSNAQRPTFNPQADSPSSDSPLPTSPPPPSRWSPPSRAESHKDFRLCLAHLRQRAKGKPPVPAASPAKPSSPHLSQEELENAEIEALFQQTRHPDVPEEESRALFEELAASRKNALEIQAENGKKHQKEAPRRKYIWGKGWQTEGDCGATPGQSAGHRESNPTAHSDRISGQVQLWRCRNG